VIVGSKENESQILAVGISYLLLTFTRPPMDFVGGRPTTSRLNDWPDFLELGR
jgi:hypothetical protein